MLYVTKKSCDDRSEYNSSAGHNLRVVTLYPSCVRGLQSPRRDSWLFRLYCTWLPIGSSLTEKPPQPANMLDSLCGLLESWDSDYRSSILEGVLCHIRSSHTESGHSHWSISQKKWLKLSSRKLSLRNGRNLWMLWCIASKCHICVWYWEITDCIVMKREMLGSLFIRIYLRWTLISWWYNGSNQTHGWSCWTLGGSRSSLCIIITVWLLTHNTTDNCPLPTTHIFIKPMKTTRRA